MGEELVLPVSWQTAHASFLGREAARCRLAHNLVNRSGGGNPAASVNQWLARKEVKEYSHGSRADAIWTRANSRPAQSLGHLQRADAGFADRLPRSDDRGDGVADCRERSRGTQPALVGRHCLFADLNGLHPTVG